MKQRSLNLLLITVILTLCALFSGCTYSNSETNENKNSVSQPTTIARKSYTEEEFVSFSDHNKFPKSYLIVFPKIFFLVRYYLHTNILFYIIRA